MSDRRTLREDAAGHALPAGGARGYYAFQDALAPDLRDRLMASLSEEERARQRRFIRDSDRDAYLSEFALD